MSSQQAQPKSETETENKFHDYVTHKIPWFVHLMWVTFWVLAIGYVLTWLVPALQREILSPK